MPSDGSVTGTPTPRKDSVASSAMACARSMVAITISGGMQLGKTWRHKTRCHDSDMQRAASTYSRLRSTRAAHLEDRQSVAQGKSVSRRGDLSCRLTIKKQTRVDT